MASTTTVTYAGRHTEGVEAGDVFFEHGVPTECPDDLAKALCSEQPDAFSIATPATPKKKEQS
jgi:hypothetical protein